MANHKKEKSPFRRDCFEEALAFRGLSIRSLGKVNSGIGWSEKTIRRAMNDGEIAPELLIQLSKKLNIDPEYLKGTYHKEVESYTDPRIQEISLRLLHAVNYPYLRQIQREKPDGKFLYDRYMENILVIHNIEQKQFNDLSFEKQKQLQLEIEQAVCKVLIKYFEKDAYGKPTYPDIYGLWADIDNYDPDFVEPTDDEYEEMMKDIDGPFAEKYDRND